MLPANGAPVARQRTGRLKELYNDYVRERTLRSWKFWIVSSCCLMVLHPIINLTSLFLFGFSWDWYSIHYWIRTIQLYRWPAWTNSIEPQCFGSINIVRWSKFVQVNNLKSSWPSIHLLILKQTRSFQLFPINSVTCQLRPIFYRIRHQHYKKKCWKPLSPTPIHRICEFFAANNIQLHKQIRFRKL